MGGRLRDFRSEHTKNTPPTQELELLMKELDCAGDWCVETIAVSPRIPYRFGYYRPQTKFGTR